MPIRSLLLLAAAAMFGLQLHTTPVSAGQRVALVIGNASYAHAPSLANPLNDASDVGTALDRLGFAVTRLHNADYSELRRGLQQFSLAASASEMAVVFYAGHGIEVDKRNFLIPVDARLLSDADVEFETVPLDLLSRAVDRAKGLRLIILDACRDNPFAVAMQRSGATRSIGRGLASVEPSGETLVAYAAKEGTVAADGEGRNSPYTSALLAHLEEPGLEVGLMFRKVRDAVLATTGGRQEPFVYGSLSSEGAYLVARPEPEEPNPVVTNDPEDRKTEQVAPGNDRRLTAEELAAERVFWESVKDSQKPQELQAYLDRYSEGTYAVLARSRLKNLVEPEVTPDVQVVAVTPDEPERVVSPDPPAPTPESIETALGLNREERRLIQRGLASLGFDPGPADGLFGHRTRRALETWQFAQEMATTGYLDAEVAKLLLAAAETARRDEPRNDAAVATLSQAFQLAAALNDAGDRAWTLSHLAKVQLKVGDTAGARTTLTEALQSAERDDDWYRDGSLQQIAVAQAQAGDISGALATARKISDESNRGEAFAGIAPAQAEFGDAKGARESLSIASRIASGLEREHSRSGVLYTVASAQVEMNNISGALTTKQRIKVAFYRVLLLRVIAEAQTEDGDFQGAARTIARALAFAQGVADRSDRARTLAMVAEMQTMIGDARGAAQSIAAARLSAESITDDSMWRMPAFGSIVRAQAVAGDIHGAFATVQLMKAGGSRDGALSDIADAQAKAGDIAGALATVHRISSESWHRDSAFTRVVHEQAKAGDVSGALDTMRRIVTEDSRVWALISIAEAQAGVGTR